MTDPGDREPGFTLVELLVAMAISSMVLAVIYVNYQAQLNSQMTQKEVVEMQQNIRGAMHFMEKEIRMAGHDPTLSGVPGITAAFAHEIRFTMDIHNGADDDGDGLIDEYDERGNGDGDVDDIQEQITYRLSNDADNDGVADGLDCDLQRSYLVPGSPPVLRTDTIARNIDALNFVYLDENGAPTATLAEIRSVQVTVVARAGQNPRYGLDGQAVDGRNYQNQQRTTILPPPGDPFRRFVLTADVRCRNLQ